MLQLLQAVITTLRRTESLEEGLQQVLRFLEDDSNWSSACAVLHGPLFTTQLILADPQHERSSEQRMVAGDVSAALEGRRLDTSGRWTPVSQLPDAREVLATSDMQVAGVHIDEHHALAVLASMSSDMTASQAQTISVVLQQCAVWLVAKLNAKRVAAIQAEANTANRAMLNSQELSLLGSWDWDGITQKLVWTPMMYEIYGFDQDDESLPDLDTVRGIIVEEDLPMFDENMSAAYRGEAPEKITYRIRRNGEIRYLESRATIELDQWESIERMHGTLQDVTQARQHELQLEEMNATLEARVKLRTAELSELVEELKAFSYSVSHDLRAPLRAILAYATEVAENPDRKVQQEHIVNVLNSAKRMNGLIEDLLRLSRASTQEFRSLPVDLSQLCQSIVAHMLKDGVGASVHIDIEPGLEVVGDPDLLRVAFDNLLSNAVKYSSKVDTPRVIVRKTTPAEGYALAVSVVDNGDGFDESQAHSMFKPFQRLHTSNEFEGTGIGLATVARIVNRHHAHISAHSPEQNGAEFVVSFPEAPVR